MSVSLTVVFSDKSVYKWVLSSYSSCMFSLNTEIINASLSPVSASRGAWNAQRTARAESLETDFRTALVVYQYAECRQTHQVFAHCSPNIIRVFKSRRMIWTGHVENMGDGRLACRVLVGKPQKERPLGRWEGNMKVGFQELGWAGRMNWYRQVTGSCECGTESSGSIKREEFFE
jgi:hypothetical protein